MLYNCHPIGLSDCGLHSACVQQYSYQHLLSLHPHKLQEWKVNWTILYFTKFKNVVYHHCSNQSVLIF